jgi:D-alanyl-lipoteichoic acid acyltransferase DltB (MBOAT superfamily)
MKLWDLHVHVSRGLAVEWSRFMPYLLNAFAIVLRHEGHGTRPPRRKVLIDLARGLAGTIVGLVAVFTLRLLPWRQYPLLVEHMVKALLIFVSILCWLGAAVAIVRLCGGGIRDFSDAPLLARTPADFWRRYNRVFQQYFHENIFKRAGGRRWPAAATILIFALSGLMHEYVFGIAIGRVQGFQITFFLLQGVAVAATFRVKPRARPAIAAWTAATITFNLVTSLLFFLSFHAIVPLYANPLPAWLQR